MSNFKIIEGNGEITPKIKLKDNKNLTCRGNGCSCGDLSIKELQQYNVQKNGGDGHEHNHELVHEESNTKRDVILLSISVVLLIIGIIFHDDFHEIPVPYIEYVIFIPAYLIAGYDVLLATLKSLKHANFLDEFFLMSIATIGAFITHNPAEAVGVMIFYKIGEILQDYSVNKSKKSISALLNIKPQFANIISDGCLKQISPDEVQIGDIFVVKPGEKVPLDGIVTSGESRFDTSPITGESIPRKYPIECEIPAGVINISNVVEIKAIRKYKDSSIAKIMHMVEEAEENKSETTKFITKFAHYYTPAVVFSALFMAIIIPIMLSQPFSEWIYRAAIFLVISCPCALVISVPLGYFGGIGGASNQGILVKGANYLDILAKVDTILFDKTGTITKGNFEVIDIIPLNGFDENEFLEITATIENFSTHPIAKSILKNYGKDPDTSEIIDFSEVPAHGVKAIYKGRELIAGNDKILHLFNIPHDHSYCVIDGTCVHVAYDGKYRGYLIISDEIKESSFAVSKELKKLGIKKLIILSGDEECIVESIANDLKFDEFYSNLLPEEKVQKLSEAKMDGSIVAFVGDGINDAPVLANADVGIVMGALGSDAAIETADVVLMTDSLDKIATAIQIGRKTRKIIWQNIYVVFLVKLLFLTMGAFGIATMWEAVFADVGVALIAIFNSSRILRFKNN